jgi:hypothetical protein
MGYDFSHHTKGSFCYDDSNLRLPATATYCSVADTMRGFLNVDPVMLGYQTILLSEAWETSIGG